MIGSNHKFNYKLYSILFIYFFCNHTIFSQNTIKGSIVTINNEEIPFAIIEVKIGETKPIYIYSDDKGYFNIKNVINDELDLKISALGYSTAKTTLNASKLNTKEILKFILKEKNIELEEVIVRTKKPLIVKKDTIVFRTKYFSNGTENNVEDLLKKIPNLNIDDEGTIRVGNQEIEKIMVDGDDFFEKGYKILSKNMPTQPIEEVEILKNYSNNSLLKGIEYTNKVAINLKLNENAKRVWFGNIDLAYGVNSKNRYEVKGNLMNFGKTNKFYFLTNLNNTGIDATGRLKNLINPLRVDEPESIGDNQSLTNLIDISISNNFFKKERTNFNNTELASLNSIFNPTKKLKIKALTFFNWDENNFFKNSIDRIDFDNTKFENTSNYNIRKTKKITFGKLDITYKIADKKILKATTKYNIGSFNDYSNIVFNNDYINEDLQYQNTLFDQKFNYTNKITDKKVILITGRFINEKTPQNYKVNQFLHQGMFPDFNTANNVLQKNNNEMLFMGVNAHLLEKKQPNNLIELQLGNEFRRDKLTTRLSLLENKILLDNPDGYKNYNQYSVNNLYLKTKYLLEANNKLNITGKINFYQYFNTLKVDDTITKENSFIINPSAVLDWTINTKNKISLNYSLNTKTAKSLDTYNNFVLTDYNIFSKGTGNLDRLTASNYLFNYQLGNWSDRFFANTFITYNKNHDYFTTNTILNQNTSIVEKIRVKNQDFISINSNLDYFFKSISSNLKLKLNYVKSEYKNIVNGSDIREIHTDNYNYGGELRSAFNGMFNYHLGIKWEFFEIKTTSNSSFINNVSFLDLFFVLNEKINIKLESERYYFGNLSSNNNFYFLDFKARYSLKKEKINLEISGNNLFNTNTFRVSSINDIGTSTTEYRLLPRYILLKMELKF